MVGPAITLTTDFGLGDGYVAAMKAAILSINPSATIIDITHDVPPQDVFWGAYVLSTTHGYFPKGTVHVAVVDPGVGSRRKVVAVWTGEHYLVGPDNGVLSLCLPPGAKAGAAPFRAVEKAVPKGCHAVALTERRFHLQQVSATFHARDIFAPVAAHLSLGTPLKTLGPRVTRLQRFIVPEPTLAADAAVEGLVLHIDHFGNAVTNLRPEHLPRGALAIHAGGAVIHGVGASYADGEGAVAVWGSQGTLEIAVRDGSAAKTLGLQRGDVVGVRGV